MILHNLLLERGLTDIIYEYSCGISYKFLDETVRKHFKRIVEKDKDKNNTEEIYNNLVDYFFRVFSRGHIDEDDNRTIHIKIFLRHVSRLLSNKKDIGLRMLFNKIKNNNNNRSEGLYSAIGNMIKDIEKKSKLFVSNIYYANK